MSDDDDGLPAAVRLEITEPAVVARRALERAKGAARERGLTPGTPGRRRRRPVVEAQLAGSGRDPQLLGDAALGLLAERGWHDEVSVAGVFGRWEEITGPQVAEHCTPEHFEDGRLVLRASSTSWANELRRMTSMILARLEAELGEGVVEEVTVLAPSGRSFSRGPWSVPGRGPRDTWV